MAEGRTASLDLFPYSGYTSSTHLFLWPFLLGVLDLVGVPMTLATAHVLGGLSYVFVSTTGWFLMMRRIGGLRAALLVLPPATLLLMGYGRLDGSIDFLSMTSESLPLVILSVAALVLLGSTNPMSTRQLVAGSMVAGLAVWAKPQSGPIAVAFIAACVLITCVENGPAAQRVRLVDAGRYVLRSGLVALLAFATPTLVFVGVMALGGTLDDVVREPLAAMWNYTAHRDESEGFVAPGLLGSARGHRPVHAFVPLRRRLGTRGLAPSSSARTVRTAVDAWPRGGRDPAPRGRCGVLPVAHPPVVHALRQLPVPRMSARQLHRRPARRSWSTGSSAWPADRARLRRALRRRRLRCPGRQDPHRRRPPDRPSTTPWPLARSTRSRHPCPRTARRAVACSCGAGPRSSTRPTTGHRRAATSTPRGRSSRTAARPSGARSSATAPPGSADLHRRGARPLFFYDIDTTQHHQLRRAWGPVAARVLLHRVRCEDVDDKPVTLYRLTGNCAVGM